MPKPNELRYYERILEILDRSPKLSVEAIERMATYQRTSGFRLPAALFEWYSVDGAEEILRHNGRRSSILPLDDLLVEIDFARQSGASRVPGWYLARFNNFTADLLFEDIEDPTVEEYYRPYSPGEALEDGYRRRQFLSSFVLETVWYDLFGWPPEVTIELGRDDGRFGPVQLQYILQGFAELARSGPTHGRDPRSGDPCVHTGFKFFRPGLRIEIGCFGDATTSEFDAFWFVSAKNISRIRGFLRDLFSTFGYMPFYQYSAHYRHEQEKQIDSTLDEIKSEFRG